MPSPWAASAWPGDTVPRLAALLLALAASLGANTPLGVTLYAPAKTSFPMLAVPVGVRAVGMGEAYTAAGSDVYALHWDPAGLAAMSGYQIGLAHNQWSEASGIRQEFATYGQSLPHESAVALSADYFDLGRLEERSATGDLTGQSTAYALAGSLGLGWGRLPTRRLKLGVALEFCLQSLFDAPATEFGGSLGAIYDFTDSSRFAAALKHLGSGAGAFSPPSSLDFGLSTVQLDRKLTLALDLGLPLNGDPVARSGAEYDFGPLALRCGWRYAIGARTGDVQSGPTLGAGFKVGMVDLDYAYVPYDQLATTHRISATLALPGNIFAPIEISPERSTATAKAFYDTAVAKDEAGDPIEAMFDYKRAVDAYPIEAHPEAPQSFYQEAQRKYGELLTEVSSTGQSEGVRQQIERNLSSGVAQLAKGQFKDAINSAKSILALDDSNQPALKLKASAESGLRSLKKDLAADARASYSAGNLAQAIESRREALNADASDPQSAVFFSQKKAEIDAYLRKVHRQGIDAYIAGRFADAISIWEGGVRLDPSDPLKMGRDIDKARKHLNLN